MKGCKVFVRRVSFESLKKGEGDRYRIIGVKVGYVS